MKMEYFTIFTPYHDDILSSSVVYDDSQGNNNNHTQPVVNRLTLLLNCELFFLFTFLSRYLLPLNTSTDLKRSKNLPLFLCSLFVCLPPSAICCGFLNELQALRLLNTCAKIKGKVKVKLR